MTAQVRRLGGLVALAAAALAGSAGAGIAAQPQPWEMWHQPAATAIMDYIEWFDAYTLWFIAPITLFVLALLVYVMVRFNHRVHPTPSRVSHNTAIEVAWTVVPILILMAMAVPSFDLLERQLAPTEQPQMTVKAIGQQWYWDYEYEAQGEGGEVLSFSSNMLQEEDRDGVGKVDKGSYPRLLAVDNEMVVPVNTMVRVLVTADPTGVMHNFAMPSFGLKMDAIPGRLNETWFKAEREGLYYGQCSELCGKLHAFMPIAVRVVSAEQFASWRTAAAGDLDGANKALMAEVDQGRTQRVAGN